MDNLKEAMDKIHILRKNRINLFKDDDQALDVYNNNKDTFFDMVEKSWNRYEQNELFPPKDTFEDKDIFKMVQQELRENPPHKEEPMMTEKEVLHHHLLNIEDILQAIVDDPIKKAELKEIYDLLVIYWTKL